jgi:outer membrane protein assembly factor BamB
MLSRSTGKLLWKEKLDGPYRELDDGRDSNVGIDPYVALQAPGFADLNGSDVPRLVVWCPRPSERSGISARPELRAVASRDGHRLWRQLLAGESRIALATGRLVKDGPDKILVASSPDSLQCVDFKSGQSEWTWTLPKPQHYSGSKGDPRPAAPVLVDLDGNGRRSVCLLVQNTREQTQLVKNRILVLDPPNHVRRSLDVRPPAPSSASTDEPFTPEKERYRLWGYPLRGDGREVLLYIHDRKVRALTGNVDQPLWEWPLPKGVGTILDVQPAGAENDAVVVVRSDNTAYGLDGGTGQLRWRCEGNGEPAAVLSDRNLAGIPHVVFHVAKPECTIDRQAWPVLPTGRYAQPVLGPVEYPASADDPWGVPLPWEGPGRAQAAQAVLPALACLALLVYFAWKRRWRVVFGLLVCALAVPLVVGAVELRTWENWIAPEQHHAWGGWYWLWVYTLSAPDEGPFFRWLLPVLAVAVFFLPLRWRLVAYGLLIALTILVFFLGAQGRGEVRYWLWEFRIRLPAGFGLGSPLVWMIVWLSWVGGRAAWKQRASRSDPARQTKPT